MLVILFYSLKNGINPKQGLVFFILSTFYYYISIYTFLRTVSIIPVHIAKSLLFLSVLSLSFKKKKVFGTMAVNTLKSRTSVVCLSPRRLKKLNQQVFHLLTLNDRTSFSAKEQAKDVD